MASEPALYARMEMRVKDAEKQLAKFGQRLDQSAGSMEKRWGRAAKNMQTSMSKAFGGSGLAKGIFAGVSAAGAKELIDASIRIENALKVAGLAGQQLDDVYDRLFQSATKNAAPLETLVELYGRVSLVQKNLGASSEDLLKFTDSIAMALRVAGTSPEQASGALLQLSQALGGGTVRAEEFNSMMEGGLPILQAAAAGLKEAGGDVAKLRTIMLAGELSSKALFKGIEAGTPILEERLAGAVLTIDQRMTNLKTALVDAAKRFNNSSEAANTFGTAIDNTAAFINNIDFESFISKINQVVEAFARGQNAANTFANDVGAALGLDNVGKWLTGGEAQASYLGGALTITSSKVIQDRITDAFKGGAVEGSAEMDKVLREKYGKGARLKPESTNPGTGAQFTPVSIKDFPADGTSKDKKKRSGTKTHAKTADQQIDSDIQAVRDRIETMKVEQSIVGQSYEVQEKRRMSLELEQAALAKLRDEAIKKGQTDLSNIKISEETRGKIDAVSEAYARQAEELRRVQEQQDRAEQAADDFYDTFKSSTVGAITGANSLADALQNIANKLADLFLSAGFDALFKPSSGGVGGGAFGSIFSGLGKLIGFDSGGYTGPGAVKQPAGVVHKGEVVWSQADVRRAGGVGTVEAMRRGLAGYDRGGPVSLPSITAPRMPDLSRITNNNNNSVSSSPVININVSGASGDDHVRSLVREGVKQGLTAYDKGGVQRTAINLRQVSSRGLAK
ncbi:tape measure protein [Brucella intermedia]|uniref:tape measure protein n=1 Tax=Brucella intermedia TaxID=94625 RepID=UPI00209A835B|nr:tape measure protein [Brucella intermedia]MCO7736448.1 tape measure protein [Brucella intermedia]